MKVLGRVLGFTVAGLLLVGSLLAIYNARSIRDWLILRNYTPPERIAQIAAATSMNDYGKRLFYVHNPQIEDKAEFNQDCTSTESSLVLGCYNGVNIYIYDVDDERLSGVHEVTAAHEMLHAAYDRLSDDEKADIDALTARQLAKISNERIHKVIKSYRARDPGIVSNELHSILGSEVRDLDQELEEYYKRYFFDRQKVVALSEKYEQVFTSIQSEVERYDAELLLLKAQIDQNEQELQERAAFLTAEKAELDRLAMSNRVSEYNNRVPGYNASVESYNQSVAEYRERIREYNQLVETRNNLTLEQNELIQSLDSRASEL